MSEEYNKYLQDHTANVVKGFIWLEKNLPEVLINVATDLRWQIEYDHDSSKRSTEEYYAYDDYFYGKEKTDFVIETFNLAWLKHIHKNPHHWQHWVLINDEAEEGTVAIQIPEEYVIEMICDWWSFSWANGKLKSIFTWYEEHSERMILHSETRKLVEDILSKMKEKIESTYE